MQYKTLPRTRHAATSRSSMTICPHDGGRRSTCANIANRAPNFVAPIRSCTKTCTGTVNAAETLLKRMQPKTTPALRRRRNVPAAISPAHCPLAGTLEAPSTPCLLPDAQPCWAQVLAGDLTPRSPATAANGATDIDRSTPRRSYVCADATPIPPSPSSGRSTARSHRAGVLRSRNVPLSTSGSLRCSARM